MKDFDKIIKEFPSELIEGLKNCKQDPEWHAEGNVYIHTKMVYNELLSIIKDEELSDDEIQILKYAVILHDIGKPKCTTLEDGHIRQHGHSRLGYHMALELLHHKPNNFRYEVAMLIKNHGNPGWLIEEENCVYEVVKTSYLCNIKLLLILVEADIKGRISGDKSNFFLSIDYFKELAIEYDCYENKCNLIKDNITKYCYLKRKSHFLTDNVYDYTKSKVIIMSGLPGSGKDTYINENLKDMNIISLDDLRIKNKIKHGDKKGQGRVIQEAKQLAKNYLNKGIDFVWNSTNTTKQMRSKLIDMFDVYDAYITIVYIDKDLQTILKQNRSRKDTIPEKAILKLFRSLEIPTEIESHELKIVN